MIFKIGNNLLGEIRERKFEDQKIQMHVFSLLTTNYKLYSIIC